MWSGNETMYILLVDSDLYCITGLHLYRLRYIIFVNFYSRKNAIMVLS